MKTVELINPEFNHYFSSIYGNRWNKLLEFFQTKKQLYESKNCFKTATNELRESYFLDEASVIVAKSLDNLPGERVLDLCAAPGGKSLILIQKTEGRGEFVLNERSSSRRARLRRVIDEFIPKDIHKNIQVTSHDGTKWCLFEKNAFDKILIDAPCSGEEHLVKNEKELARWKVSQSKRLSVKQFSMLASALDVVKVGGKIVYSTCSINPIENDEVVKKLFKKREGRFKLIDSQEKNIEKTEYGYQLLPDKSLKGPMFFTIIERIE